MRLVSLVAMPDRTSEAVARRVISHFHRQTALAHPGSIPEHDDRSVARSRTINNRSNRPAFKFPPDKGSSFRERKRKNLRRQWRRLRMSRLRRRRIATWAWLVCRLDRRRELPLDRKIGGRLIGAVDARPDATRKDVPQRGVTPRDPFHWPAPRKLRRNEVESVA